MKGNDMKPRKAGEMEVGKLYHCWRREDGKYFVATRHEDSCKVIIVLIAVLHSLSFADEEYTFGDEIEAPDMPIPDVCCVCGMGLVCNEHLSAYGCPRDAQHPSVYSEGKTLRVLAKSRYAGLVENIMEHGFVPFWARPAKGGA